MTKITLDLDELTRSHIITQDQRDQILAWQKHGTNTEWTSRLIQILATFGSIVTGLGVMLLIAANWDTISDMTKTFLMIGATSIAYLLGFYFSYIHTNYTKTGQALMLLGSLLYGASIMLLGQIYNLGGTFASALLVWTLPVLLLAYASRFITLFFLGIGLIYAYIFVKLSSDFTFSGFVIANIFIAVGYLSLTLLRYHRDTYQGFVNILSWTGWASILGGLFSYTFIDFWRHGGVTWYASRDTHTTIWILLAIIAAWVVAIIVDVVRANQLDKIRDVPLLLSLAPIGLIFLYTLTQMQIGNIDNNWWDVWDSDSITMFLPALSMNIVYLAVLALMIYLGVRRDNRSLINIAMIYLALYLFGKYLAFVYDSKMDGAYIFIGGGLACIAMTILVEKARKRILLSME
jgi:uncharacterized membrane protein